jgi:Zn finger protein HypA/HybF involved in hydrogenase expression
MIYKYTKNMVDAGSLGYWIGKDAAILKECTGCYFKGNGTSENVEVTIDGELDVDEKTALDAVVAAHDGVPLNSYRIWCAGCGKFFETTAPSVPTTCPTCEGDVSDISEEQFAIRGLPVQTEVPSGHYIFNVSGKGIFRRWLKHRQFVQFETKLNFIPSSIQMTDVNFDGTADLFVERITRKGFIISCTAIGKGNNWGLTSVEFDWEAVL